MGPEFLSAPWSATSADPAATPGQFHWVHSIAIYSKGNIYTGEVDNGKRVQKFKPATGP